MPVRCLFLPYNIVLLPGQTVVLRNGIRFSITVFNAITALWIMPSRSAYILSRSCLSCSLSGIDILTADDHDTVKHPPTVITAESRQAVHAEPEETVIEELERLLSFELCKYRITTSQGLESLEFSN